MSIFLTSLLVQNFRTFGELALELTAAPGLVIISGPNGQGKSSFFDSIEWGLTGAVNRLDKFRRKKDSEAVYLTREGTPAFSHSVDLGFSDGSRVRRTGDAIGSIGTDDDAIKHLLVSPKWGREVTSVSTYLALTHILGQASQQRFMSRDSDEQWEALRVPSGVERLEAIRKRLRGNSSSMAFKRKEEEAAAMVGRSEERLARWDQLIERLRKLERNAEAAGAIPKERLVHLVADLWHRLTRIHEDSSARHSVELPNAFADIHLLLVKAERALETEGKQLEAASKLPAQYAEMRGALAANEASFKSLSLTSDESDEAIARLYAETVRLDEARREIASKGRRLNERRAVLLSSQADLRQAGEATARLGLTERSVLDAESDLRKLLDEASATESRLERLRALDDAFNLATEMHASAIELVGDATRIESSEENLSAAENRREAAEKALALQQSESELAGRETAAIQLVSKCKDTLFQARSRSDSVASAVAVLASHVEHDDTACPLCKTNFPAGKLKLLVESSAQVVNKDLAEAQVALDDAQEELRLVQTLRRDRETCVTELHDSIQLALEASAALQELKRSLLIKLETDAVEDLKSAALKLRESRESALDKAAAALANQPDNVIETQRSHERLLEAIRQAESKLAFHRSAALDLKAEAAAAEQRFNTRIGYEGIGAADIDSLIENNQAEVEANTIAQRDADSAYTFEAEALSALKVEHSTIIGELDRIRYAISQVEGSLAELIASWEKIGFQAPPAISSFSQKVVDHASRRAELNAVKSELARLIESFEATVRHEELANVQSQVTSESQGKEISSHRILLESAVSQSKQHYEVVKSAHQAILRLGDRLQSEANSFSDQFLKPLNDLISAFNDALLTTPGTSVAFNTDYFVNRTKLSTKIRRRGRIGEAPIDRSVDPQLILSEGQLAANGFSILCSASVSYPWSRWKALLLDDPLQHSDIIHASALTDVMRNLVELEGYQIIVSSHDRSESEFMERKFSAASLPCTVVNLVAETPTGVKYETRNNAPARDRLGASMRQGAG